MPDPLKICVAGCGRVAGSHLDGIMELPEKVELTALVSRSQEKLASFGEKYGAKKLYSSLEEALADDEIDAVDICLPNHLHKDATIQCAAAGKHILVEKPMANTVSECQEMIDAANENAVELMVGQSRRFHDAVFQSKKQLEKGSVGNLFSITAMLFAFLKNPPTEWWRDAEKAGGLMIPLWGNHIIDYILWMFDESPNRIYCEAYSNNPEWEGEDETTIMLGFSGNRHATIKMSWNTVLRPSEDEWDGKGKMLNSKDIIYERYIQGSGGTMVLDDETNLKLNGNVIVDGPQKPGNFALQVAEFADAVREGRESLTSGRRVIDIIKIQEAALKSAATGTVVKI